MGSAEGFSVGGVVVKEVPREIQGACSSGAQKEKPQTLKQKNSSNGRRGDKRNSRVQKNRCDSFTLKNGLVGFNSAAGGNNFFGLYGLKPDVFDITKYVNELSLDELLQGCHIGPEIVKDDEKTTAKPSDNLLQSVRKACSILQTRKILQTQNFADFDRGCIEKISTVLVDASPAAGQTTGDGGDSSTADLPSPHKVQAPADKIRTYSVGDSEICQPKDILQRLALTPAKNLDLLLSDASKATSSSRYSTDPRLGKTVAHRTGLPPFPWSHSFSGHNKLGADAGKLSTNRKTCNGRWAKVRNCAKGSADLLVDFESLTFDQCLVPKVNSTHEHSSDQLERFLISAAWSTTNVPADVPSPTYAAAQTLCDMATCSSKENISSVKSLKRSFSTKACKLKPIERSDRLFDVAKSTVRPQNAIKVGENGFPSKKLKLPTDVSNVYNGHAKSPRKEPSNLSAPPQSFKPPPRKLLRDSDPSNYSLDFVKTSYMIKPPRAVDRPTSSQQKLKKVDPMKWSRS